LNRQGAKNNEIKIGMTKDTKKNPVKSSSLIPQALPPMDADQNLISHGNTRNG